MFSGDLHSWQGTVKETFYLLFTGSLWFCSWNLRSWSWEWWHWSSGPDFCCEWQKEKQREGGRDLLQTWGVMEWCILRLQVFLWLLSPFFPLLLLMLTNHKRPHSLQKSLEEDKHLLFGDIMVWSTDLVCRKLQFVTKEKCYHADSWHQCNFHPCLLRLN